MKKLVETKETVSRENVVKFEVGKKYFRDTQVGKQIIKVISRTKDSVTVFWNNGPDDTTPIECKILNAYKNVESVNPHPYYRRCFISANSPYESVDKPEITEVESAESEIPADDLEKELAIKKIRIAGWLKRYPKKMKYFQEQLMYAYAQVARAENEIWEYQLDTEEVIEECEAEVAVLEAEILNRKITEAQEYSYISAEAFNVSVQAEIDMAARAVEPVTFEIERFNEGEISVENAATIDTAVMEIAADEYALKLKTINREIADIKAQIEFLEEKLSEKVKERNLQIIEMECQLYKRIPKVTAREYVTITSQNGKRKFKIWKDTENRTFYINGYEDGSFQISDYKKVMATYSSAKNFKAAIEGLATAIERGDSEFTFPADEDQN